METLEEAAEKEAQLSYYGDEIDAYVRGSLFGAKWQAEKISLMEIELNHIKTLLESCEKALEDRDKKAERMYSEEDLVRFMQFIISQESLQNTSSVSETTAMYYIEQFKKK